MRKYYKGLFESYGLQYNYKKRVKTMSKSEMDQLINDFAVKKFGHYDTLFSHFTSEDMSFFNDCLKTIILSDRSNKGEAIIEGLDFEPFR